MVEKNWGTVQEGVKSGTGGATAASPGHLVMQDYHISSKFDPSAFFDKVDEDASSMGSMAGSLRNALAQSQQAQVQATAAPSVGLGMGGTSRAEEEGENS